MTAISEAQKRAAYHEAQQILRLDKTWQHLMPGERKPNFRRAARAVIRRALGQKVAANQPELDLHSGLMHEHAPREAALVERTLKNGMYDPSILHSFQRGVPESEGYPLPPPAEHFPDLDVFVHDPGETIYPPSHFEPGTGTFHSATVEPPEHAEVPLKTAGATLPSEYEAVH